VVDKARILLGLTEIDLVSKVENLVLTIETLYTLGFRKSGAERFYEFVQRNENEFVAKYDISKKEMTTSQTFALAETTSEQLAEAKAKLEAFIAKVMDAAENRSKEG
jgi:CRISPR/Cas system-associated protein Cas5 (RAMP superfamily)